MSAEKDTVLGYWWLPNQSDVKSAGTLRPVENHVHELEILSDLNGIQFEGTSVIHGEAHGQIYTLLNCVPVVARRWFADSVAGIEVWRTQEIVRGSHLQSADELFDSVAFAVEGGQDWSQLSGMNRVYTQHGDSPELEFLFERKPPASIRLKTDDFTVELRSVVGVPGRKWSSSLEENTLIVVTSHAPLTLGEWKKSVVIPMRGLLQFATKNGGTIHRAAVRPISSETKWIDFHGLDRRLPWTADWMTPYPYEETRSGFEKSLFHATDFVDFSSTLPRWFDLFSDRREALTSVLDLSLGAPSPEFRFFATARLIERLAERYPKSPVETHPGNRNGDAWNRLVRLLTRWQSHLEPLRSTPEIVPWAARRIVKTRNCFAHHSQSTCREAVTGHQLLCLESLVRTVIDCEICSILGLPQDTVPKALADARQYRLGKTLAEYFALEQAKITV